MDFEEKIEAFAKKVRPVLGVVLVVSGILGMLGSAVLEAIGVAAGIGSAALYVWWGWTLYAIYSLVGGLASLAIGDMLYRFDDKAGRDSVAAKNRKGRANEANVGDESSLGDITGNSKEQRANEFKMGDEVEAKDGSLRGTVVGLNPKRKTYLVSVRGSDPPETVELPGSKMKKSG
jgi:hypothetical protein